MWRGWTLTDYVAKHLDAIEAGLSHLKTEYTLTNQRLNGGAGGRTDVLAKDKLDHVVVIEVKKSDRTARETLHELSKYISLLIERDRVPRELIRCMVISTKWHELDLPLAYFASTAMVDVIGLEPYIDASTIKFSKRDLVPISLLPQFSPEFSIYSYPDHSAFKSHLQHTTQQVNKIPFVRVAIVEFELKCSGNENITVRAVVCMWKIRPEKYNDIEAAMKNNIGHLYPYAYPGWEAECDCLYWLADEGAPDGPIFISAENERGTPEKVRVLIEHHIFKALHRIGDWPHLEIVNTPERILAQLEAVTGLSGAERTNRYVFHSKATPRIKPSWVRTASDFLKFINHIPNWAKEAELFLTNLQSSGDVTVTFYAFDKNHFFYALHQCTDQSNVSLSQFDLRADFDDGSVHIIRGCWFWDGVKRTFDANNEINRVFGSCFNAARATFNAVDKQRYDDAYHNHGFFPTVLISDLDDIGQQVWNVIDSDASTYKTLDEFVEAHKDYVNQVSIALCSHGNIPTSPNGKGGPILICT